jgi:hypothetical protein
LGRVFSAIGFLGLAALAGPAAPAIAGEARASGDTLVIAHVNVVDVIRGEILRDRTVVVRDGRIAEVRRSRRSGETAGGGTLLDASGRFLIPGLWDMHAHIRDPERELPLLVANGVLGIRDMGGTAETIFALRERVASGALLGPRIIACGPIVDGPEPGNPPISIPVKDAAEGRQVVRSLDLMGADCVKVHDRVPRDAYLAIADEAGRVGLPLVGHVPVCMRTMEAATAGQRSIEHQVGLRGTSSAEEEVMRSEETFDSVAEAMRTGDFSLIPATIAKRGERILDTFDPKRAQALYRLFAERGTALVPTLVTLHGLTFVDDLSVKDDPRLRYIPAEEKEWWRPEKGMLTRYRTPAYIAYRKREFAKTLEMIPVARRAGVVLLAGTDMWLPYVYPGFSTHDEMALFVQAGLTPAEALRTATIDPARFLRIDAETGSIKPGRAADLVLLEADPLRDIAGTRTISAVVARGRLLRRADLDALLQSAEAAARRTPSGGAAAR